MTPTLKALRDYFNAARDRRKAKPSCIDTDSAPGSWQAVLDSGAHSIRVVSDYDLDARLALRKAARQETDPWKRGHIIRKLNAGAV
jgi:hypothetical protein